MSINVGCSGESLEEMGWCTKLKKQIKKSRDLAWALKVASCSREPSLFDVKRRFEINPFIYPWNICWHQWAKMIIMSFVLIPLRLPGFIISFSISYFLCFIATTGQNEIERDKPMCGWRKKMVIPIFYVFARIAYFFVSFQWICVKGIRCSRKEAPILVLAPHSAFMDSLVVVYLGMSSVVGKTETANSIIGYFLRMTQPMLVTREDPNSRQKTVDQIISRAKSDFDWPQMLIFPEGTCTNRSCLINFKSGAFIPGCPIQPVILRWPNRVDCVTWTWDGPGIWTLLWMMFTQFHSYLEIEFLPIYQPSKEEKLNPKLFADNVRSVMAKSLKIPTTNHSYEDCRHMTLAKKHGMPFSDIIVEFTMLFKKIMLQYSDTISMLDNLTKISKVSEDPISVNDFCRYLHITDDENIVNMIFQFYDKESTGTMKFKDFFINICLYALPLQRRLALEYIIGIYGLHDIYENHVIIDILKDSFGLPIDEVDSIVSIVKSHNQEYISLAKSLDEIMHMIGKPFNMYENYQREYNQYIKQVLLPCVKVTIDVEDTMKENHEKKE